MPRPHPGKGDRSAETASSPATSCTCSTGLPCTPGGRAVDTTTVCVDTDHCAPSEWELLCGGPARPLPDEGVGAVIHPAPVKVDSAAADIFDMVMLSRIETAVRERVLTYTSGTTMARTSARHDIAALMVEHDDGTCTVLWAGTWRAFSSRSEQWATRAAAMEAVTKVTGEILIWSELAPQTWTARAA